MGVEASRADDQGVRFISQHLPAAAKPLDWNDLEGSAIQHALANTLMNTAMLKDRAEGSTALRETPFRRSFPRWKTFQRDANRRSVSWALDSAASSSTWKLLNNDIFLALQPSVQHQSILWRDCDSSGSVIVTSSEWSK